jgi:hypothetical protein
VRLRSAGALEKLDQSFPASLVDSAMVCSLSPCCDAGALTALMREESLWAGPVIDGALSAMVQDVSTLTPNMYAWCSRHEPARGEGGRTWLARLLRISFAVCVLLTPDS